LLYCREKLKKNQLQKRWRTVVRGGGKENGAGWVDVGAKEWGMNERGE